MRLNNLVMCVVMVAMLCWYGVAMADNNDIGIYGGITSPHSECKDDNCSNQGYAFALSYQRDALVDLDLDLDHLSLNYGASLWHMKYTTSDREHKGAPKHNTQSAEETIVSADLKPGFKVWRLNPHGIFNVGTDGSETYLGLGGGIDIDLYKGVKLSYMNLPMKSKCTWHRLNLIGIRYEF